MGSALLRMTISNYLKRKPLAAKAEGDAVTGRVLAIFTPEDLLEFGAFDANLAFAMPAFAHPDYPRMSTIDAALQQDHVTRAEVVPGGEDARTVGRNVEGANMRDFPRRKKIDLEGDGYGQALFT